MRALIVLLSAVCGLLLSLTSCSEEKLHPEENLYNTTIFSVYECNDNYTVTSASTAFVSIDAEIRIWEQTEIEGKTDFKLVDILRSGQDGKAIYKHNKPILYYSAQKYNDQYQLMSNTISPLQAERTLTNKFQVEGIFTSEDDLKKHAIYNLPHLSEHYIPKIGSVKFKDLNNDLTIDLKDAVDKIALHTYTRIHEEIVFLASDLLFDNR